MSPANDKGYDRSFEMQKILILPTFVFGAGMERGRSLYRELSSVGHRNYRGHGLADSSRTQGRRQSDLLFPRSPSCHQLDRRAGV